MWLGCLSALPPSPYPSGAGGWLCSPSVWAGIPPLWLKRTLHCTLFGRGLKTALLYPLSLIHDILQYVFVCFFSLYLYDVSWIRINIFTVTVFTWPGIIQLFSARKCLVSDIPAEDGNVANLFFTVWVKTCPNTVNIGTTTCKKFKILSFYPTL